MLPGILKHYMRSPISQGPWQPTLLTRQKYRPLFLVVSRASGFTTAVNARTRGRGRIGCRDGLEAARESRGARCGDIPMNFNSSSAPTAAGLTAARPVSHGYKVDISRGERVGRSFACGKLRGRSVGVGSGDLLRMATS
jgi:hypothetical protein